MTTAPESSGQSALRASTRKLIAGVGLFVAVCVVAVGGYMVAGWSFDDAVYMVIITMFGVGYGEVRAIDSAGLRAFTIVVIVTGYGAVIYTVGTMIQILVDGELRDALRARRRGKEIGRLEHHTIICGLGRMGSALAAQLADAGKPFVVVEPDPQRRASGADRGYRVVEGDATDEATLERAGVAHADVLATVLSDDALNVFVTLTAREMNPDLTIIARGEYERTERKLLSCGADTVVSPTNIGASKMSQIILRPSAEELLDRLATAGRAGVDIESIGLEFDEFPVEVGSQLAGKTLGEIEVRGAHGYLVVGVRRPDGSAVMHPPTEQRLEAGDTMIVLGYHDDIPEVGARFDVQARPMRYRGVAT